MSNQKGRAKRCLLDEMEASSSDDTKRSRLNLLSPRNKNQNIQSQPNSGKTTKTVVAKNQTANRGKNNNATITASKTGKINKSRQNNATTRSKAKKVMPIIQTRRMKLISKNKQQQMTNNQNNLEKELKSLNEIDRLLPRVILDGDEESEVFNNGVELSIQGSDIEEFLDREDTEHATQDDHPRDRNRGQHNRQDTEPGEIQTSDASPSRPVVAFKVDKGFKECSKCSREIDSK